MVGGGGAEANQICPLTDSTFLSLRLAHRVFGHQGRKDLGLDADTLQHTLLSASSSRQSPQFSEFLHFKEFVQQKVMSLVGNLPYMFLRNRRCWGRAVVHWWLIPDSPHSVRGKRPLPL